jgi:hypothetical protein
MNMPDVCSYDMNHYVFLPLTNIKSSVHRPPPPHCTKDARNKLESVSVQRRTKIGRSVFVQQSEDQGNQLKLTICVQTLMHNQLGSHFPAAGCVIML